MRIIWTDTAKLLKETEFPWGKDQEHYWKREDGKMCFARHGRPHSSAFKYEVYPAPPQSRVQEWLREEPKWPVEIYFKPHVHGGPRSYHFYIWQRGQEIDMGIFKEHGEGLEECLKEGLKRIKKEPTNKLTTANCIICGETASCAGGHVHRDEEKIVAAFCKTHFYEDIPHKEGCKGCYGEWEDWMGVESTFQLSYIDSQGIHPTGE